MPYQALATRYRPQSFDDVIGQEAIVQTLRNAIESDRVHPAYIFSGIRGVGKTTVARLFAKGLNCAEGPTADPCNDCPSCIEIREGRSMDVLEIDGATHTKAEEARDLTQIARYTPARDTFRVFIIDEVHMLSTAAFNALLKTLEEPPPYVVFLLATTVPHKIPETIHSRSQHFEFRRLSPSRLTAFLRELCGKEGIEAEPAALELIARAGEGSVRDSLTLLDRMVAFAEEALTEPLAQDLLGAVDHASIATLVEAIRRGDGKDLVERLEKILDRGHDLLRLSQDLTDYVRRLVRESLAPVPPPPGESPEVSEQIRRVAEAWTPENILRLQDLLLDTISRLRGAPDPEALLELQLIKAAYLPRILPLDQVLGSASPPPKPAAGPPESDGPDADSPPRDSEDAAGRRETPPESPDALRFTSLIPFQRMDPEEASSYEGISKRTEAFRERVIEEFPLARNALENARLSADQEGVLHIALPESAPVGVALLSTPDRERFIQETAKAVGFPGGAVLETRSEEAEEPSSKDPHPEPRDEAMKHKAVREVERVLGARLLEVRETPQESPGGEEDA